MVLDHLLLTRVVSTHFNSTEVSGFKMFCHKQMIQESLTADNLAGQMLQNTLTLDL